MLTNLYMMVPSKLAQPAWMVLAMILLCFALATSSAMPVREGIETKHANAELIARSFAIENKHDTMRLSITKRTMFSSLGLRHSHLIAAIEPADSAARALEDFYSAILFAAIHVWPHSPPEPSFAFRYGAFELLMSSAGGPIPWEWMVDFARMLQSATALGFVSTYHMVFANPDRSHAICVTFTVSLAARLLGQAMSMMQVIKPAESASGSN